MKRLSLFLVVLGVFALVVSGCSGSEDEANGDESTAPKTVEDDEAEEAGEVAEEVEEAAEAPEEAGEVAEIGVPECDEYIQSYMACVSEHVPEEARAQMVESFEATQEAWAQAAADEAGRETLAEACTQALEQTKEAMAAYDCEW